MSYLVIVYHIISLLTSTKCQKGEKMFINKTKDGLNNVSGKNIRKFRREQKISQRELADQMQLIGIDIDKNAIQRIECGKRFVTDIEIIAFSKVFNISFEKLLLVE